MRRGSRASWRSGAARPGGRRDSREDRRREAEGGDGGDTREDTTAAEIAEVNRRLQVLHQRQGRGAQFKTKAERDAWLKDQVKDCEMTLGRKRDEIGHPRGRREGPQKDHRRRARRMRQASGESWAEEATLGESEGEYNAKISSRNAAQDQRKELQRRDAELDAKLASKTEEVKRRDKHLEFTMPRELYRGLNAVQRIVKDHGIKGVHGPLIELMECDERFFAAVEAAATNQLFHIVVDDDEVASKIIEYLNKDKGGSSHLPALEPPAKPEPRVPRQPGCVSHVEQDALRRQDPAGAGQGLRQCSHLPKPRRRGQVRGLHQPGLRHHGW